MPSLIEQRIDFLKVSISDAQELIRFTDTKVAFVVTIVGAYIVVCFQCIESIAKYKLYYSSWFWISLILFLFLISLCIAIITRFVKPTNNPSDNIKLGAKDPPTLKFFLTPNKYSSVFYPFFNSKKHNLEETFENYLKIIQGASEESIINSLTFELLKISFIRNIKNDRFYKLLVFLLLTSISFAAFYYLYITETHNIIEFLKKPT